jgi:hypothetical protein
MIRGRAHLLVGILGVALWASWYLPPLLRTPQIPGGSELAALWVMHMLPLSALLLAPLVGLEATSLLAFPAALVLPFAGSAAFGWELGRGTEGGDLVLGGAAFLLYAVAAPLALRRSRASRAPALAQPLPGRHLPTPPWVERGLALARPALGALLPLALAYAVHFDRRLQVSLADSFGTSAGYAAVLVDLSALALGVVAADLAFFAPLRGLRGRAGPREIAVEVEEIFRSRRPARASLPFAGGAAALLLAALAAYLAWRP